MTNDDFVTGIISDKKLKQINREIGFIHKLTIKTYSSSSKINIHFYLEFRIPIMHRQFFRIISQNPEYVKTFCNGLKKSLQFACRRWIF